jgi:SAM-dependent methyltransferase
LDYVYSSYLLEDFLDWQPIVREWGRVIRPGGFLVILIPDHERFSEAVRRGQPANPSHQHEGRPGELSETMAKIGGFRVVRDEFADDEDYSILFVAQKPG